MTTLDDIAARDAEWTEAELAQPTYLIARDRRYLLTLVREAREVLREPCCAGCICNHEMDAIRSILLRLTEGSDRT
jgi:hypothetical protein